MKLMQEKIVTRILRMKQKIEFHCLKEERCDDKNVSSHSEVFMALGKGLK